MEVLAVLPDGDIFSADGPGREMLFVLETGEIIPDAGFGDLSVPAGGEPTGHAQKIMPVGIEGFRGQISLNEKGIDKFVDQ